MPRKLLKFLIIFDNSSLLYFPGQFLSGRVLIELQHETPALALHFHVVGEGVVQVRSARQDRNYDKESYIDFRMKLLGDNGANSDFYVEAGGSAAPSATIVSGATTTLLSPGIHSFPFKLGLPHGLPSTFLGRYGWIQYYCKAALREANGLIHKNHQVFIVMNPIDLNYEEQILSQPFKCDIEHRVGGIGCIGGGHVKCFVSLDRGGYVPGENITVTATIKNLSQTTIKQTRVALTETIKYLAHGKCIQIERRELAQIVHGKIRPMAKDDWYNEQLYVPPLPPTNLRGCHLIKIQYDVFFIIEPKSMERPIKLQLPIVLGTYPFRQRSSPLTGSTDELANTWPESILKPDTHYPSTLPIFRPWLHEKADVK